MKKIDSHQHFWKYHPIKDAWITDEMSVIQRDFLPTDLQPVLEANNVVGCVAVQSDQSLEETSFLLSLANAHPFVKGVVGWADLRDKELAKQLEVFAGQNKLKGFRHIVQAESDSEFLLQSDFLAGINQLKQQGYTYDLLITHHQLRQAIAFAKAIEEQPIVIDHIAKPDIKSGAFETWAKEIEQLAAYPHFYCKVSGLVTEADWKHWKVEDFEPYIHHILTSFGTERIMFGSDWPVCTVAASYEQVIEILNTYIGTLSIHEQENIWYRNAERFYNL